MQIGWVDSLALKIFDRFASAAIKVGHLRVIMPNGSELSYGDPATTAASVATGASLPL